MASQRPTASLPVTHPGTRGEGRDPRAHAGGGGEQDEGSACPPAGRTPAARPVRQAGGRVSNHTQHL